MVILKNIKKTNNMISADYYPEGKEPKGFMRIEDGKVTEHENASSFAKWRTHQQKKQYYGTRCHQLKNDWWHFYAQN